MRVRLLSDVVPILIVISLLVSPSSSRAEGTQIYDTVPLHRDACTIAILSGDILMCAGDVAEVSAELECADGYVQVHDPQWFLDGEPLGVGYDVALSPQPGVYTLLVSCGSCDDAVTVTVLSEAECYLAPRLDAHFSDEDTEATTGIFMQPNIGTVIPQTFGHLKYHMRPFTLDKAAELQTGEFTLAVMGDNLEVYNLDGSAVSLPASYDVALLPITFLVNATAFGTSEIVASYEIAGLRAGSEDVVRVRVGNLPDLAGGELGGYPWFESVKAINDIDIVQTAIDPVRHAERLGLPYRVYIVDHQRPDQWAVDNTLTDVSGGFESCTLTGDSIADNIVDAWTSGLSGGTDLGVPYDVVYDFGLDGTLDPGDIVSGLRASSAGFYVVRDLNLEGPYSTEMVEYTGGYWLYQRTYYPCAIAGMRPVPLVVISHGNGHDYTWYDYLGEHLASYGYVVMSHSNNTGPGIETASTTTLTNTDYFLGNLDTIADGIFEGHIDSQRIIWIGHSRGGEGVVRAYDRLYDGAYTAEHYTTDDIICISSIAPTVFLGTSATNSHEVNYHLIAAGADGDVHGGASTPITQSMRLSQAARGPVQLTYIQGACHNDFNCCGFYDCRGPDLIGRPEAQRVAKSYYLALIKLYAEHNVPAKDYFTRMYAGFHPSGIADHVVCATTYRDALDAPRSVIDDYQSGTELNVSSSGGAVTYDVSHIHEATLDDGNTSFTWYDSDPMNGMTQASQGDLYQGGVVFDWEPGVADAPFYECEVIPEERDFRDDDFLSFRSCQGTRHPQTVALGGTLTFRTVLRDADGITSGINFDVYGSLTHPYLRTGEGSGAGWANEFSTVRIRLADFENDGSGIDLARIVALRFEMGLGCGAARGRIGIDDIELTQE